MVSNLYRAAIRRIQGCSNAKEKKTREKKKTTQRYIRTVVDWFSLIRSSGRAHKINFVEQFASLTIDIVASLVPNCYANILHPVPMDVFELDLGLLFPFGPKQLRLIIRSATQDFDRLIENEYQKYYHWIMHSLGNGFSVSIWGGRIGTTLCENYSTKLSIVLNYSNQKPNEELILWFPFGLILSARYTLCLFAFACKCSFIFLIEFLPKLCYLLDCVRACAPVTATAHMCKTGISNCSLFQKIHSQEVNNKLWFGSNTEFSLINSIPLCLHSYIVWWKRLCREREMRDSSFNFTKQPPNGKFMSPFLSHKICEKKDIFPNIICDVIHCVWILMHKILSSFESSSISFSHSLSVCVCLFHWLQQRLILLHYHNISIFSFCIRSAFLLHSFCVFRCLEFFCCIKLAWTRWAKKMNISKWTR